MSTSANIVICHGDTKLVVYRHWDGYPAETGADIITKLREAIKGDGYRRTTFAIVTDFVRSILNDTYEQQSYETKPKHVYDLMDVQTHGIEHYYVLNFRASVDDNGEDCVGIYHAARPLHFHDEGWMKQGTSLSLKLFTNFVNADRAQCNVRLRQMKAKNPGNKHYGDAAEYEMI